MTRQEGIALGLLVVGVLLGVVCIIADLAGGPSYLHVFTWIGGTAFGYGVVTLITASVQRRRDGGAPRP